MNSHPSGVYLRTNSSTIGAASAQWPQLVEKNSNTITLPGTHASRGVPCTKALSFGKATFAPGKTVGWVGVYRSVFRGGVGVAGVPAGGTCALAVSTTARSAIASDAACKARRRGQARDRFMRRVVSCIGGSGSERSRGESVRCAIG
jgi:hypothetical protein